jgi:hypothetical protein
MANPIPLPYQDSYVAKPYNVRPGMPAKSYVYIAVASEGGAINTTVIPANTTDTNPSQKVTPLKSFAINNQKGGIGATTFYVGMPKLVPAWLRTQLLSLGLVS